MSRTSRGVSWPLAAATTILWLLVVGGDAFLQQVPSNRPTLIVSSKSSPFSSSSTTPTTTAVAVSLDVRPETLSCKGKDTTDDLEAYAREGTTKAAEQAQKVLDRLLLMQQQQQQQEQDLSNTMLTPKHFALVIEAWGRARLPERAEQVYRQLEDASASSSSSSLDLPNRITWTAMLRAYVWAGNVGRAEAWLEGMGEQQQQQPSGMGFRPRTADYNILLGLYARRGETQKSEQLIKRMVDLCKIAEKKNSGDCLCQPNIVSYNLLLEAYASSQQAGSGQRAQDILEALRKNNPPNDDGHNDGPNVRTYAAVIQTLWRDRKVPDAIAQAQAQDLYDLAKEEGLGKHADRLQFALLSTYYGSAHTEASPLKAETLLTEMEEAGTANLLAYNKVLKAWKLSERNDSAERAEAILERMKRRNLVDRISYTTVIGTLAAKGDEASAQRANQILDDMIKRFEKEGKETCKPNTQTWNSVILAWVRSGNPWEAQKVLDRLEKHTIGGADEGMAPTVVSYSTVMDGWAKSREPGALTNTEKIFQRMQTKYQQGNKLARPNLVSYVTLINAYANSRDEESAQKAQEVLFDMYEEYTNGNKAVKPNTQTISVVIEAWQRSGRRDAGERAESLLDWMISIYKEHKDDSLCPNEYSFSSTISAWSKSRKLGKSIRARKVLNRMIELNDAGILQATPNTYCYTAVINSCANCENDELDKQNALRIAVVTYKELMASESAFANQVTFGTLITALRNLMPPGEKRDSAVLAVFRNAASDGYVNEMVVRRLQSVLPPEKLCEVCTAALSKDGTIRIDRLPTEWHRKVAPRQMAERSRHRRQR